MTQSALLALADGSIFYGTSIGVAGQTVGEVVFNTAMTGYQEILTDPSYAQQIVTLTCPHVGNVGVNEDDAESGQIWAAGLIIRHLSLLTSNWRSTQSLEAYLRHYGLVAIANIDTRRLTRLLREKGALNGCIMTGVINEQAALNAAQQFKGLQNLDLAKVVSTKTNYTWQESSWTLNTGCTKIARNDLPFHVVAYDFGIKRNILRQLVDAGCYLTVVPAETPAADVLSLNPDGVFFSNGPGDPAPCQYAIEAIKVFLEKRLPLFGICLGHQLLGLACGAKTIKMKFGHHGANHPVKDLQSNHVMITSQNHGFAVEESTLPATLEATHRSLFDGSLQGIRHTTSPAFSFQGHPEASPGPHDATGLFSHFINLMSHYSRA